MIPPTIYGPIISIVSGAIGYAIREYSNRVNPMINILSVSGAVNKRTDLVDISQGTCDELKGTVVLTELPTTTTLGEINECLKKAEDLKEEWPAIKPEIEKLLITDSDDDFKLKLGMLLKKFIFPRAFVDTINKR